MKRVAFGMAMFVVGGLFAVLNDVILFSLWFDLGWRKPVADWLGGLGYHWLAGHWGMVWVNLPEWILASLLGAVVGFVLKGKRWLAASLLVASGFIIVPHIVTLAFSVHFELDFGWYISVLTLAYDLLAVPLLVLMAWISSRFRAGPDITGHHPPASCVESKPATD